MIVRADLPYNVTPHFKGGEGEGVDLDGDEKKQVFAGDTLLCYAGESHSLSNEREQPLKYLAVIVQN